MGLVDFDVALVLSRKLEGLIETLMTWNKCTWRPELKLTLVKKLCPGRKKEHTKSVSLRDC